MSYCFICAEPNPCDEHKHITQARREQLTAANKAIAALSEALEAVSAWNSKCPNVFKERASDALTTHADAIKRARTNDLDPRADKG